MRASNGNAAHGNMLVLIIAAAVVGGGAPRAAAASVTARFETPVTVHVATQSHAWFSAILDPKTGPLVVAASLGGDGTKARCCCTWASHCCWASSLLLGVSLSLGSSLLSGLLAVVVVRWACRCCWASQAHCPGTCAGTPQGGGRCPARNGPTPCSLAKISVDGGRSWGPLPGWAGANEILPLGGNGTFVTLPYKVTVEPAGSRLAPPNTTASSPNSYGRIDPAGNYTHSSARDFDMRWVASTLPNATWPATLVHSGSVVQLRDGSHLTTMYGHGSGSYRHWGRHPAVYFVRSTDSGLSWQLRSSIPWRAVYGNSSDGPGEPTTARLPDGTLWCVFRSDSSEYYWSATSGDDGVSWHNVSQLPFAWSVKPRLRVTSSGFLVLTGGRPGIDMWVSGDRGGHWSRFNIAAEHNRLMSAAGASKSLLFDPQVVDADGPHWPRALYASRAVQLHPHGGQSDFVWLSARTPHGAYVW